MPIVQLYMILRFALASLLKLKGLEGVYHFQSFFCANIRRGVEGGMAELL